MRLLSLLLLVILFTNCETSKRTTSLNYEQATAPEEPLITQSLFADKSASISEENIQKILNGTYELPQKLRVAIIKLESPQRHTYYWNDEDYMKNEQAYIETLSKQLKRSSKVSTVTIMPGMMVSKPANITNLREAAVRMQADILCIFSSVSDIYAKYKIFSKPDIKAFATTQVIVLDNRTALVPFTYISSKDVLSKKTGTDLDIIEARKRVQSEAVKMTIDDVGSRLAQYLQ